jgi:colanic acid/amylovoran biosynthesis protein
MRLLVTGVTRTGNLGGAAMLCALEDVVASRLDDYALASILPSRDAIQVGPDKARIVPADYRIWLLLVAPVCILLWPLRRCSFVRSFTSRLPILRAFAAADAVADLSGIAFVDGRGFPLLYYNFAITLPAFFLDVPVHKLSQALGPFEQPLNRRLASWTLKRCRSVAARGKTSLGYVRELGVSGATYRQDTSFALDIPEVVRNEAASQIVSMGLKELPHALVIISPSAVVRNYCRQQGIDMEESFAAAMAELSRRGMRIALLPHSTNTGIAKNDDFSLVAALEVRLAHMGHNVCVLDPKGNPRLARALIGEADVFVASRFHSLIAALSQAVPVATIGWSHKYAEAAAPFHMEEYTMDYSEVRPERLVAVIEQLVARRHEFRAPMLEAAVDARESARAGIEFIMENS